MARPARSTRSALRLVAALPLGGLVGCTGGPPQVCSLELLESSVSVDIGALPVDPATVGALLCVEFYADDASQLPPRLDALERDLQGATLGYRYFHALDAAAQLLQKPFTPGSLARKVREVLDMR